MGRKKKEGAVKPGQIKENQRRYTFIARKDQIERLEEFAFNEGISRKEAMELILKKFFESKKNRGVGTKIIDKIKAYTMKNKISSMPENKK